MDEGVPWANSYILSLLLYTNFAGQPHPDLTDGRTEQIFGSHDEKLVNLKRKYDPTNVFNKWGDITVEAVDQNHGYNTMNLKPEQLAVE